MERLDSHTSVHTDEKSHTTVRCNRSCHAGWVAFLTIVIQLHQFNVVPELKINTNKFPFKTALLKCHLRHTTYLRSH